MEKMANQDENQDHKITIKVEFSDVDQNIDAQDVKNAKNGNKKKPLTKCNVCSKSFRYMNKHKKLLFG